MQKRMYINEIHQKQVGCALLKREVPPPNVKNKLIKSFFEKALTTHPPAWIMSLNMNFFFDVTPYYGYW